MTRMAQECGRAGRSWRRWMPPVLVVVLGCVAYCDSLRGPFIFDDIESIRENPSIRTLAAPAGESGVPDSIAGRPVLRLTLAMDYAVAGLNVEVYHATNLLIHLSAGLLLYGIVRRNLSRRETWGERFRNSSPWLAAFVAGAWTVHPLQTEAVSYIVQRGESLAGLFYLGVVYCLIRAAGRDRPFGMWSVGAFVCCALGMGTKEVVVTAPLIAMVYDRTFLAGSFAEAVRRRWKLYLALAATWTIAGVLVNGGSRAQSVGFTLGISGMDYMRTELGVIAHYLWLAIWPRHLVLDYYGWPIAGDWRQVGWGWLVVALLGGTAVALWKKPWLGFLGAWFFLNLAPTSIVPIVTEVAAEHRMYLPLAAPIALAAVGAWAWCDRRARGKPVVASLGVLIMVLLMAGTILRNDQYASAEGIWRDTVAARPLNARAHYNLGYSLAQSGRQAQAAVEYREALRLEPDYYAAAVGLGGALFKSGQVPPDAAAHYLAGVALQQRGDWKHAAEEFNVAMSLAPDFADAAARLEQCKARGEDR